MKRLIPLVFAVLPLLIALAAFAVTAKATPIYTDLPFPSEFPAEHIVELPKYDSKTQQLHAEAWIYACSLSRYDCKGLAAPIVVYEDMTDEPGLLGRYWRGARVISLNEELRGADDGMELVVLVHETIHYLQYHRGAWDAPFSKIQNCGLEKEAFTVGEKVMKYILEIYDYRMRGWDMVRANTYGCPM